MMIEINTKVSIQDFAIEFKGREEIEMKEKDTIYTINNSTLRELSRARIFPKIHDMHNTYILPFDLSQREIIQFSSHKFVRVKNELLAMFRYGVRDMLVLKVLNEYGYIIQHDFDQWFDINFEIHKGYPVKLGKYTFLKPDAFLIIKDRGPIETELEKFDNSYQED